MASKQAQTHRTAPPRRTASPPKWTGMTSKEVEELVTKYARDGVLPARIGVLLRDIHAVPSVRGATGKTVSQILASNQLTLAIPEDLQNLMRRAVNLRTKHLSEHTKDHHNARGLQLIESRIRRLALYYKRTGRIAPDWKYDPTQAKLLLE